MENVEIIKATNYLLLETCFDIRKRVFVDEKGVSPQIERDEYDITGAKDGKPTADFFILKCDGIPCGAVRIFLSDDKTVKVQRFCILGEYRGRGLGERFLQYLEGYYAERGVEEIWLDAKCEASGFYEKGGYKSISDKFFEAGVAHVKMMKRL